MSARYSRQTGYTVAKRSAPARRTTRTVQQKVKLGPTAARYIGLAVLGILALLGLSHGSDTTTNSYEQSSLRAQISNAQAEVDTLTLGAQRAQALQNIAQSNAAKNLQQNPGDVGSVAVGDVPIPSPAAGGQGKVAGVSTDIPR